MKAQSTDQGEMFAKISDLEVIYKRYKTLLKLSNKDINNPI